MQIHLVEHPQSAGPDGMAEAFQSAVKLNWEFTVQVEKTVFNVIPDLPAGTESQIFHGYGFGDGKTVMNLGHTDLLPRIFDPGLFIRPFRRPDGCFNVEKVEVLSKIPVPGGHSNLKGLDEYRIFVPGFGDFRCRSNGRGTAVPDSATVKQTHGPRN